MWQRHCLVRRVRRNATVPIRLRCVAPYTPSICPTLFFLAAAPAAALHLVFLVLPPKRRRWRASLLPRLFVTLACLPCAYRHHRHRPCRCRRWRGRRTPSQDGRTRRTRRGRHCRCDRTCKRSAAALALVPSAALPQHEQRWEVGDDENVVDQNGHATEHAECNDGRHGRDGCREERGGRGEGGDEHRGRCRSPGEGEARLAVLRKVWMQRQRLHVSLPKHEQVVCACGRDHKDGQQIEVGHHLKPEDGPVDEPRDGEGEQNHAQRDDADEEGTRLHPHEDGDHHRAAQAP
mmetsp:Transcript_16953/g.54358  ORF Transcript_16953/g.54358 Transcript_16953/m.54358 type:complete len:291 (+) Transcript_16953:231-1103(+)